MGATSKRIRFIERDFMLRKILNTSEYIQPTQAEIILDEQEGYYMDVTFIIYEKESGFKIEIMDNYTDELITVDGLNNVTFDYYTKMIRDLSLEQIRNKLSKIA